VLWLVRDIPERLPAAAKGGRARSHDVTTVTTTARAEPHAYGAVARARKRTAITVPTLGRREMLVASVA
jgi:hypothetical protein